VPMNVLERNQKWMENRERKVQQMKEEAQRVAEGDGEARAECTFRPKIIQNAESAARRKKSVENEYGLKEEPKGVEKYIQRMESARILK
jgi:hypothetical protein